MRDECFIRGAIPMTKSEVRAVSLSKLELTADSIVYDIGAGTGSVSVEAAFQTPRGHVYAFEQKEEGCRLIRANRDAFGIRNLTVVPGKAPDSLAGYPAPDRVFVGGTGGNLEAILDQVFSLNPAVQVVVNVIALESLSRVTEYFKNRGMEPDITCVQVSRAQVRGGYHMMQGQNPVYIITAGGAAERKPAPAGNVCIPRILIAAPASGSGKTTIVTGLLAALKRRGLHCASFKCGPDYIDPMFHRKVLGIPGCNLDSFFLEEREVRRLFTEKAADKDVAVIEGVMGYYDGVAGNTVQASTYEIARITDTPVILVLDGKKSSLSLAAEVKGFLEYKPDSRIVGVILNRTSPAMLTRLRPCIEELGPVCLGAVPQCSEAEFESRHLGLTIPEEQTKFAGRVEALADELEQWLDVDGILELAKGAPHLLDVVPVPESDLKQNPEPDPNLASGSDQVPQKNMSNAPAKRRMAIAMDEAFCFYYQENLDFLKESGWELVSFSPLRDAHLPERTDGILLGGGYPELYGKKLSENHSMLLDIRQAAKRGVKILAECGGFLYLHDSLEGSDGETYPMAGVIRGKGYRTDRLSRFGYITLSGNGGSIRGHEFHYWDSTAPGASMRAEKPGSSRGWDCMHVTDHMAAGFPHLYYRSAPEWVRRFLEVDAR